MGVKDSSRLVEEERNAGSRLPSSTLIPAGCLYVLIFRFNLQPAVRDFQRRQRRGETDSSRLLEHNSRQQAWLVALHAAHTDVWSSRVSRKRLGLDVAN